LIHFYKRYYKMKENESEPEHPPKVCAEKRSGQNEEGERMTKLRTYLDKTVERLVAKVEQKHFVSSMPEGLNKEYLGTLQNKLASIVRRNISKEIERGLKEDDFAAKLNSLDALVKETPHSINDQAWRPPCTDTVESCTVAIDLAISLQHKDKLSALLQEAEDECDVLTQQVLQAEQRLQNNQAVLGNLENGYKALTDKIVKNQQVLNE